MVAAEEEGVVIAVVVEAVVATEKTVVIVEEAIEMVRILIAINNWNLLLTILFTLYRWITWRWWR